MKRNLLFFAMGVIFTGMVSYTAISYEPKTSTAEVDQQNGIHMFIKSRPVKEYDFLGAVNMPEFVMSGKPKEMIDIATKRARKQYPEANAIIFTSDNLYSCDAIKIK